MEFEQIIKRIDWLEKQQRKTSDGNAAIEERLSSIEREVAALAKQSKSLEKGLAEITGTAARLNQFEDLLSKHRKDMATNLDEIEKKAQKREVEITKRGQTEYEKLSRGIEEVRKLTDVSDIRKQMKLNAADNIRITQSIADVKARAEEIATIREPLERGQKSIEEARRTDIKRIADLQGDLVAIRKRLDETRDKMHLNTDSLHVVEGRMNDLLASESERKQAQIIFIEQQTLAHVERDRAWKEWNDRVDAFKKQASTLDTQVQAAEEASRSAKRAQESYIELNQKLERRINEITEMQRLGDERSRQEWAAFKAEDQKRWTSYTLSQDESIRELRASVAAAEERVHAFDEVVQTAQDQLHQTADATERQMQELMNWAHEWLTATERIMGHGKKTASKASKASR
jgi:chromosome segregation ATPase